MFRIPASTTILAAFLLCAVASAQEEHSIPGMPTSGGYNPPALSLQSLLDSDKILSGAVMAYAQSGDATTFRESIQSAATAGDLGAELLLAEQYIPEQCTYAPNRDVPDCDPDGKHHPTVLFRKNPLDLPASYEDACRWLERASAQGSGEASEVLAQLITRMLLNGHPTGYTATDSTRLHALAHSQGFDVEPLSASCYQLTAAEGTLTFAGPHRRVLTVGAAPVEPFSDDEMQTLQAAGAHGTLQFQGETSGGESVLLSRPAGPPAHIRVILDHDPGHEIHLPIPAHHDVIYLQSGDRFITLPPNIATLPRFLSIMPQRPDMQQVSIFVQQMDGAYSGTVCARFAFASK